MRKTLQNFVYFYIESGLVVRNCHLATSSPLYSYKFNKMSIAAVEWYIGFCVPHPPTTYFSIILAFNPSLP